MKHYIPRFLLSVTLACCFCAHGFCQDTAEEAKQEQPAVRLRVRASEIAETSPEKSTITLTLNIEPGVAIYTNEPNAKEAEYQILMPTTIELLGQQGKIKDTEFKFPAGILIESITGDYSVYTGAVKITATFPVGRTPEKMKLKYYGYIYSGAVANGVC